MDVTFTDKIGDGNGKLSKDSSGWKPPGNQPKFAVMEDDTDLAEKLAVCARIAAAREAAGLTQEQVAEALGIRQQRAGSWETGEALPNTPRLWRQLCELLAVDANYLLLGRSSALPPEMRMLLARTERRKAS